MWFRFKEDINSAPPLEGVYRLADGAHNTLYIGSAQNIRAAIEAAPNQIGAKSVEYFSFELNSATSERAAKDLIEKEKPVGNKPSSFW